MQLEIKKIGNSDGLLLPKELMQRLDLKRGQELHVTELAGGGLQLMPARRLRPACRCVHGRSAVQTVRSQENRFPYPAATAPPSGAELRARAG